MSLSFLSAKWEDPIMEKHIQGHNSNVLSVCYNHDGSQTASSSKDGVVKVWNFKPRLNSYVFKEDEAPVHCVKFNHDGQLLASTSRAYITIRTPEMKSDYWAFKAHQSTVRYLDFSSDGRTLATCSDDKIVKLWHIVRFHHRFAYSLIGHTNWVRCVKFSPDSQNLISCGDDSSIKIWDLRAKNCQKTLAAHRGSVKSIHYHPNSNFVASGGQDKIIRVWDLRTSQVVQRYTLLVGSVNSLTFDSKGKYLACACSDGTIKLYDTVEARLVYTLHGHQGQVHCLDLNRQNDYLCSGDSVGKILFWKMNFKSAQLATSPRNVVGKLHGVASPTHVTPDRLSRRPKSVSLAPSKNLSPSHKPLRRKSVSPIRRKNDENSTNNALVDKIENAMQDMLNHMALLVDTMSLMEKRLSRTERMVQNMNRISRSPGF